MAFDRLKKKRSPPRETVRASNSARAFAFFGLGRCWRVIEGRDEKRRHARGIARAGATAAMREDAKTRTPRGYAPCDRRRMPRRAVRIARRRDTREIWRTHLRQELVETEDEVFVSLENRLDSLDDTLGVDPVCRGERWRGSAKGTRRGPPVMWMTGSGAVRAVARAGRRRSRRIDRHPSRRLLAIKRRKKSNIRSARAPLSFELLHDLEELIVRVLLVLQALLELAEVRERLLLAQRVVRRCLLHRGCGHALHRITPQPPVAAREVLLGRSAPPWTPRRGRLRERARSNRGAGKRRAGETCDRRSAVCFRARRCLRSRERRARGRFLSHTEPQPAPSSRQSRMGN